MQNVLEVNNAFNTEIKTAPIVCVLLSAKRLRGRRTVVAARKNAKIRES